MIAQFEAMDLAIGMHVPLQDRLGAVNANPAGIYFRPALGGRLLGGIETPEREEYPVTSLDFHQSALHADPELRNHLRHRLVRQPKLAGDS